MIPDVLYKESLLGGAILDFRFWIGWCLCCGVRGFDACCDTCVKASGMSNVK